MLTLMAGVIMVVTTVHTMEVITMVRDRLRMRLRPQDQTQTLTLMAGVIMVVTTVLTMEVITMERDKLRMRLLPQDQTLTLTLMAGDTGEDTTAHTTEVTTGENKTPAVTNQNIFHQTIIYLHLWSW